MFWEFYSFLVVGVLTGLGCGEWGIGTHGERALERFHLGRWRGKERRGKHGRWGGEGKVDEGVEVKPPCTSSPKPARKASRGDHFHVGKMRAANSGAGEVLWLWIREGTRVLLSL